MSELCSVLYVSHVAQVGGAEESLLALLSRLDRARFRPALACPPGELAERAARLDVATHPLPAVRFKRTRNPVQVSRYAMAWVIGMNHLRRIVGEVGPQLIHSNSPSAHLYAGSVAEKAKIPCVWHSRDLRRLPMTALSFCRGASRIIAVSEAVADFLAGSGLTRPKVTRIYNGISPEDWQARVSGKDVRAELGLQPGDRILLMAAPFSPWKRHADAIRMMPLILKKEFSARLVLAGSDTFGENPTLEPALKALAAEVGVQDKVIFTGRRGDVPDLMAAAEMMLVPSEAEPFGRTAIEAMALGKPVVGTRAGGLPEVVRDGETGLLVAPRTPESLGDACLRLLENPALAQTLGEAGRRRVAAHFHIDRCARETQAVYEAVMHPPLKWIRR